MTEEEKIVDFATVRDLLMGAQERRRDLTYEQRAALFHAEWAASDNRNVSNALNHAQTSVVTTEATNDRNNAVEMDNPSTMQSGSELLNTICPKAL